MGTLEVGPARLADATEVARLHVESWREAYAGIVPADTLAQLSIPEHTRHWRAAIQSGAAGLAVAHGDAGAVGFISFGECRDADAAGLWGEIQALYVQPSHRSQGVGQALWRHACGQLSTAGFTEVCLWVRADDEQALRFYQHAGLTADGATQRIERGGSTLQEVRYRATLT